MKLVNITGDYSAALIKPFEEICCLYDSIENIKNEFPTVIIGWNHAKNFNSKVSFFENRINETTYWNFSEKEKGYNAVKFFKSIIPGIVEEFLTKKIKFKNINPTLNKDFDKFSEIKIIRQYSNDRNLYIMDDKQIIYHIDKELFQFLGLEIKLNLPKPCKKHLKNLKLDDKYILFIDYLNDIQNLHRSNLCEEVSIN